MPTTPCVVVDPPKLSAVTGVGVSVASALLDENEGLVQLPPEGAAAVVVEVLEVVVRRGGGLGELWWSGWRLKLEWRRRLGGRGGFGSGSGRGPGGCGGRGRGLGVVVEVLVCWPSCCSRRDHGAGAVAVTSCKLAEWAGWRRVHRLTLRWPPHRQRAASSQDRYGGSKAVPLRRDSGGGDSFAIGNVTSHRGRRGLGLAMKMLARQRLGRMTMYQNAADRTL